MSTKKAEWLRVRLRLRGRHLEGCQCNLQTQEVENHASIKKAAGGASACSPPAAIVASICLIFAYRIKRFDGKNEHVFLTL
jgi:hypothetical protein